MLGRFTFAGISDDVRWITAVEPDLSRSVGDPTAARAEACLRSHVLALRTFLDETAVSTASPGTVNASSGAIVMEDDVLLHNRFVDRLDELMANVPPGTPLVALGYLVWNWADMRWAGLDPARHDLATLHPSHVWGTQAYWVSRAWAEEAIRRLDRPTTELPLGVTSEAITRWSGGLIAYPPLALEEGFDTTIAGPERVADHRSAQSGWQTAEYTAGERAARDRTVALCMIVRDEAAVIERCLESVRHLIDSWVIVDTGSSDGTPALIEETLAGIPGVLHHRAWRDFGHNRTELMELARGSADYLLLLDADHTLHEAGPLPPLDPSVHAHRLIHAGPVEYQVSRLVRGDVGWRFVGRTHEYLAADVPVVHAALDAWQIVHHADGSSRATKFERDRDLLELSLVDDPGDARAVFYLAQTLESLGETGGARRRYEERARMGGFEEEAWYASWRAAALLVDDDPELALGSLLAAWNRRPQRLEPVHDAVELCARHGWWNVAHALTSVAVGTERPDDLLFVTRALYEGVIESDHQRVCAALGVAPGIVAGNRVGPPAVSGLATTSSDLPGLEELVPSVRFGLIEVDVEPGWSTFNPSIASCGDSLAMVVRSANYDRRPDGSYVIDGGAGSVVRTRNYLLRFDRPERAGAEPTSDGHSDDTVGPVLDARLIVDRSSRTTFDTAIQGLEDGRLIWWNDGWWMVASCRDADPRGMARMALAHLDLADEREVTVSDAHVLPRPSPHVHEKNWAPYVEGGELRFVYSWAPLRVMRWDAAVAALDVVIERRSDPSAADWRGGTQGVGVPGGTLFVVHRVMPGVSGRSYRHRFVLLDDDARIASSPEFTFTGSEIEFAAGLARRGDELVVSFGVDDRLAAVATLPTIGVLNVLSVGPRTVSSTP